MCIRDRNPDTIYLSPAPLYHAAPFGFCTRTLALGGTVVMMRGFDPEASLRHIQQYSITHSQWVPTMFIRMLKLDEKLRGQYDLSSHQCAIHAAAPCPKEIKHQMMDWWLLKSYCPRSFSSSFNIRMNMGGTHWEWVIEYCWIWRKEASGSKPRIMTTVPPRASVRVQKPKGAAWYSGAGDR